MEQITMCCGIPCDKKLLEQELLAKGATDFLNYIEDNAGIDFSEEHLAQLLEEYKASLK